MCSCNNHEFILIIQPGIKQSVPPWPWARTNNVSGDSVGIFAQAAPNTSVAYSAILFMPGYAFNFALPVRNMVDIKNEVNRMIDDNDQWTSSEWLFFFERMDDFELNKLLTIRNHRYWFSGKYGFSREDWAIWATAQRWRPKEVLMEAFLMMKNLCRAAKEHEEAVKRENTQIFKKVTNNCAVVFNLVREMEDVFYDL